MAETEPARVPRSVLVLRTGNSRRPEVAEGLLPEPERRGSGSK
jgi:hypothetical protein